MQLTMIITYVHKTVLVLQLNDVLSAAMSLCWERLFWEACNQTIVLFRRARTLSTSELPDQRLRRIHVVAVTSVSAMSVGVHRFTLIAAFAETLKQIHQKGLRIIPKSGRNVKAPIERSHNRVDKLATRTPIFLRRVQPRPLLFGGLGLRRTLYPENIRNPNTLHG